jgi:serine/threonine protein kinase
MAEPSDPLKTPPVAHDLAGTTVGRFVIRNRVGTGGMGHVYAAEDTTLKRRVAIKRMAPQPHSDPRDLKRFLKEAQRASALNLCGRLLALSEVEGSARSPCRSFAASRLEF